MIGEEEVKELELRDEDEEEETEIREELQTLRSNGQ